MKIVKDISKGAKIFFIPNFVRSIFKKLRKSNVPKEIPSKNKETKILTIILAKNQCFGSSIISQRTSSDNGAWNIGT